MVKSRATGPRRAKPPRATEPRDDTQRIAEMIDLAAEAKRLADHLGERFLAYLLAMAIQEMSGIDSRRAASQLAAERRRREEAAPPAID